MTLDARINQFTGLVEAGIEAWVKAGQLLLEMLTEDSNTFDRITKQHPWMTFDVLNGFLRIGRKDIYPYLLLDQSFGARRLIELPYNYQCKYYDAEITVATVWKGEVRTERKKLQDLTKRESDIAFCETGVRPISEQRKLLRPKQQIRTVEREPDEPSTEPEEEEQESDSIDENLRRAQCGMLKVRSLLGDGTTALFEKHITNALNAIGGLRFELKNRT